MDSEKNKEDQCPRDVKKQFKNQILIPTLLNFGQAIGIRYHLRIFQQLPHQTVAYLKSKLHFLIFKRSLC